MFSLCINSTRFINFTLHTHIVVIFIGFYIDRSVTEPSVPYVLYIILGLDFLLPTLIFIVNEFSGRITDEGSKREGNNKLIFYKIL